MELSAMVLSYNHPEHTARAIRSVNHLDHVLVVHNGSMAKHVQQLKELFSESRFEHLVLPQNLGYSGGFNAGLGHLASKDLWVLFLTNDCELENLPKIPLLPNLVIPKILRRKSDQVDSLGGAFFPETGKLRHCKSTQEFLEAKMPYVPGSAFLVHTSVFKTVGPMDEALGTYWDDVEWSLRCISANQSLAVDEQFVVRHHVGKTCQKDPLYSLYYFQRNRKKMSWKYSSRKAKLKLAFHLGRDWFRIARKLIQSGRHQDLAYLAQATWD